MEIIDERNKFTRFSNVDVGEMFIDHREYYMRISDGCGYGINSVCLDTGIVCQFSDSDLVSRIDGVLTIK